MESQTIDGTSGGRKWLPEKEEVPDFIRWVILHAVPSAVRDYYNEELYKMFGINELLIDHAWGMSL